MDTRIDSAIANGKRIVIVVYSFQPKTEKTIQNTLETILKNMRKNIYMILSTVFCLKLS